MKKTCLAFLTLLVALSTYGQTSDPTSLWIFRMEQDAIERNIYTELQGDDIGYPGSTGLFEKDDTLKYNSGHIFRICEVRQNKLNGSYKIFYPSGVLYISSKYNGNIQVDSSQIFSPEAQLESIIRFLSTTNEEQVYYDKNRKVKRIDHIEIIPTSKVTFKSGYVHTNQEKLIQTDYFNSDGKPISKKEYYKLYPEEKEKNGL